MNPARTLRSVAVLTAVTALAAGALTGCSLPRATRDTMRPVDAQQASTLYTQMLRDVRQAVSSVTGDFWTDEGGPVTAACVLDGATGSTRSTDRWTSDPLDERDRSGVLAAVRAAVGPYGFLGPDVRVDLPTRLLVEFTSADGAVLSVESGDELSVRVAGGCWPGQ